MSVSVNHPCHPEVMFFDIAILKHAHSLPLTKRPLTSYAIKGGNTILKYV